MSAALSGSTVTPGDGPEATSGSASVMSAASSASAAAAWSTDLRMAEAVTTLTMDGGVQLDCCMPARTRTQVCCER